MLREAPSSDYNSAKADKKKLFTAAEGDTWSFDKWITNQQ